MHGRYYRCAAGNWAGDRRKKRNRGGVIGSGIGSFDRSQLATPDSTILFACTSVITDKLTIDRSIGDFYNVKSTYLFVTKFVIGSIDRGLLKNFVIPFLIRDDSNALFLILILFRGIIKRIKMHV